jgi:glycosyltransferase involved in cell wall biosynthesis
MITVVIPALNEEETIGSVIDFAFSYDKVSEVIVVDDKSIDNTVEIAGAHSAKVIISDILGKGASMKEGVEHATNELLIFLDGDINPYPHFTLQLLAEPLLNYKAEFVKSTFSRNAGRVTELVAKPLLSFLFPQPGAL